MRRWLILLAAALVAASAAAPAAAASGAEERTAPPFPIAGDVRSLTIDSRILGEERELIVALPRGYETSDERYPVIWVLDAGWHFLPAVAAARMLSETSYITARRVPPLILVGVVNRDRNEDYTPNHCPAQHGMSFPTSGGGDAFLDFLENEAIPAIDARYRTHPYRVLCGWSLGGLLTMHALVERPGIFGGHLAISPSLWWDDRALVGRAAGPAGDAGDAEVEPLAASPRCDRDLVLTIGTGEEGGLCYEAVHELVDRWGVRLPEGLAFAFLEIDGEDHNHSPYEAYFAGLRALFADWFYPEVAFEEGLASLRGHYRSLSERRGYPIEVPAHLWDAMVRTYLAEGRSDDAVAVAEARCEERPESAMAYFGKGETCRKLGRVPAARAAYGRALDLERASSAPDTVFTAWIEGVLAELADDR